jgi:glycine/D-amino acid oxidase-like deaminating enzyme
MRETVNVVGAGLAGSITATVLRSNGFDVRVIDDGDRRSASQASSNLFVASWLKKFSSGEAANGIKILEELYGPHIDQPFSGGIAAAGKVRHIAQRHILVKPDVQGAVLQVTPDGVDVAVNHMVETQTFHGPTVLCVGYRSAELCGTQGPAVWVKVGHCYLFRGELQEGKSRLAIVSPYTHEKLYQFAPGLIYYADSVAVKLDVYRKRQQELAERTRARARKHVGDLEIVEHRIGYRPFVDGHDFGYAELVRPRVWAVNGGGKNGMVAYANAASKVLTQLLETYA